MRKFLIMAYIVVILVVPLAAQQVLDRVMAVVEDEIILQSELTQYALNAAFQMRIDPRRDVEKFEQLQKDLLQNLINQKILFKQAEEDSIVVDDRRVDAALDEQIKRMVQQLGSEAEVEKQLNMSISKIKRTFREDVRKNLMVERLQETRFGQIKISRREVEEFYATMKDSLPELRETVDISHILLEVKAGGESERQAREKITALLQRARSGEKFEDLCQQYSEDPGSRVRGGEIGFMQRGDFVPEFEEVAFLLNPGDLSDIVKTRFGFHIIQCIDRKGDKINVRHLLIRLEPNTSDEDVTRARIDSIRGLLDAPDAKFDEIAKKFSDDETTREQGGHLGLFEVENLQEREFRFALEKLKPGEVSAPFKTRFGWHILKLNSRQEPRKISLDKDWERIEAFALSVKRQKEFQKWLDEIKKDVYVEIKEDSSN
ncbi:MAG: peptidylprolyl isomerase [candidate division KSB1 bacterium]|nr:peptidylprolyl isomerase [candidate division KSB1 bacterium]MDZ7318593.1 peptidylprolyl isomerase [candidate division KSB1 bacterium]